MYVVDTMVLDWMATGSRPFGPKTLSILTTRTPADINVSSVSFWEIGSLLRKKRLRVALDMTLVEFRNEALAKGLVERSLTGEIVVAADALVEFHKDPGDRFITATALVIGATLITSDEKILAWPGALRRLDART
jgi:PIN domain nuclease of toxin-antitoxin system